MTTPDEYRRHAEQARKTAADTLREDDKVFWLKMAGDWERLAQLAHARWPKSENLTGTQGHCGVHQMQSSAPTSPKLARPIGSGRA